MPIVDIQIVGELASSDHLAQHLADAMGAVLSPDRSGATWVRLHWLAAQDYAESGGAGATEPVFVQLTLARWPSVGAREKQSKLIAQVAAKVCGRPAESVHVVYSPPAAGRVAFGGRLVPPDAASSAVLEES